MRRLAEILLVARVTIQWLMLAIMAGLVIANEMSHHG